MKWSFQVAEVAGTAIRIHLTFLLLLAWIGTALWLQLGPNAAIEGVIFVLLLFLCVVLHEFGHALAARRYGIETRDITLLPIGGLASLERMPDDPREEIVVALAGPAVNVVIAAVLILLFGARLDPQAAQLFAENDARMIDRLAFVNVVLAVFNMIPAFPMDGGRVLRALLGFSLSRATATRIAARVGQVIAVLFGFLGLLGNPLLVLIAVFIFIVAESESYHASMRDFARGRTAQDAMITNFRSLSPDASLGDATRLLLATTQQEFPVLRSDGQLDGFLTRHAMMAQLSQTDGNVGILQSIDRDIPVKSRATALERVVELLEGGGKTAVAVVENDGRFIGYITRENLAEFFMIRDRGGHRSDLAGGGSAPATRPVAPATDNSLRGSA